MAALIEPPMRTDPARDARSQWPDARFDATVEVTVSGLQVAADIGVYAHEHGNPQPLVIDVVIQVAPPAEDRLEASIDYQSVADAAHALGRERIQLIETYARRLALACLDHPAAQAVEVRVGKAGALRAGLAGTRVTLVRR